ncbi:ribosome small subunit-dependent GTPase A [bacterium]|nr:ribosome small subunit-dependent GTPase A [bacterium]
MVGRIIKNISNEYTVLSDNGDILNLKPRGKFRYLEENIKVGDFVEFDLNTITKILERKNTFLRPFISNVDYVLIITSLKRPDINYELLDKFLINVESENVTPIIVITKTDLASSTEICELDQNMAYYRKFYNVFYSDYNGLKEKDSLLKLLDNKISVVSGQTGAGKSHLLNTLKEDLHLKTQEISDALGRGKHTTRHTELIKIENFYIADTPGFSSLDLINIKSKNLKECFPEFVEELNKCKYNECTHTHEPSCIIKQKLQEGTILKSRYENYLKFYLDLKENEKVYKR